MHIQGTRITTFNWIFIVHHQSSHGKRKIKNKQHYKLAEEKNMQVMKYSFSLSHSHTHIQLFITWIVGGVVLATMISSPPPTPTYESCLDNDRIAGEDRAGDI